MDKSPVDDDSDRLRSQVYLTNAQDSDHPPAEIPPLRIHHLMACAVVAAIQLSLNRVVYPNAYTNAPPTIAILTAIGSTFGAIALTLALFSIYWRFKRLPSLSEPGQYLLLGRAIFTIGLYVTIAGMMWGQGAGVNSSPLGFSVLTSVANMIQYVVAGLFSAWCAWRVADSRTWRILFIIRAIAPLISTSFLVSWAVSRQVRYLHLIVYLPNMIRAAVQLAVEIAAAVSDRLSARRRSWTHWAGLLLAIITDVLSIVSNAIYWWMLA